MLFRAVKIFFFLLLSFPAVAQDSLKIDLQTADSLFLAGSFQLLASSMNVEAQNAQVIQAKVYPNPVFTGEFNVYDPENGKALHVGKTGQKSFQLEQLIILGGKRKSDIEIAKTNARIAEIEFQQLLRQLKFRLHTDLFTIGQQQFLLQKYNGQLGQLSTLLSAYEIQAARGNLPLKDVVRLKGAYLKLSNDRAELLKDYFATQSSLQTLLRTSSVVIFQFSELELEKYVQQITFDEIQAQALQSRPELLITKENKTLADQYLQYQKRLATPDINLFTSYDQRSGAFNNQINTGISVPLPFWNRNKGNIRAAQFKLKEADYTLQATQSEIISSIQNAYALYIQTVSEYEKAKTLYNEDFDITVNGMTENFQKRNISIVEFIDFFEAYNDVLAELTRIKTQLVISGEQINLLTGKDIY